MKRINLLLVYGSMTLYFLGLIFSLFNGEIIDTIFIFNVNYFYFPIILINCILTTLFVIWKFS